MKQLFLRSIVQAAIKVGVTIEEGPRIYVAIGLAHDSALERRRRTIGYWRVVDNESNGLLSIDLDRNSGHVWGIDLVSYGGSVVVGDDPVIHSEIATGFPAFAMAGWEATARSAPAGRSLEIVDVAQALKLSVGPSSACLYLREAEVKQSVMLSQELVMGFDSTAALVSATVMNLTSAQVAHVRCRK